MSFRKNNKILLLNIFYSKCVKESESYTKQSSRVSFKENEIKYESACCIETGSGFVWNWTSFDFLQKVKQSDGTSFTKNTHMERGIYENQLQHGRFNFFPNAWNESMASGLSNYNIPVRNFEIRNIFHSN